MSAMSSALIASLRRDAGVEQRATTLELFYDLVFVFAVTQVSLCCSTT
jgi:low temperature requirement protein LtrA